jgi:hypothetical protein
MANHYIERKIEFIFNQQAQFSADITELKELHVKAEARMTNLETVVLRLVDVIETGLITLIQRMDDLVTGQTRLDARMQDYHLNIFFSEDDEGYRRYSRSKDVLGVR